MNYLIIVVCLILAGIFQSKTFKGEKSFADYINGYRFGMFCATGGIIGVAVVEYFNFAKFL